MKTIFLAWAHYHTRTELLSSALGAEVRYAWRLGRVSGPRLLLKYGLQAWDTVVMLLQERPDVLLVQTPPVFPAVLACLYRATRPGTKVIIDSHSGSFLSHKWAWSLPIHRWCSRQAQMTIVHMRSLLPVVARWDASAMEAGYIGENVPAAADTSLVPGLFSVVVPCSFNHDEPIGHIFAAARLLPEVRFYLTGSLAQLAGGQRAAAPANVTFTGFLPTPEYYGLLRAAGAVLVLTTQDQTFQTGGEEAVWMGRPLITSNWPELQAVFTRGTVFVGNTPDHIAAGIRQAQSHGDRLADEMKLLRRELDEAWQAKRRYLQALMTGEARGPRLQLGDWAADKESAG